MQLGLRRYALRQKSRLTIRLNVFWKVFGWGLVTNLAISFAGDKGQVGNVVRFSRRVARFQHGLRKNVMELKSML